MATSSAPRKARAALPWVGWAALMLVVGLALPLAPALRAGGVPGGGPDVVSTLWGMWWFQESVTTLPFGGETELVNYPFGAHGVVLSPLTAGAWSLLEPLLGAAAAASAVVALQVVALALAVGGLAAACGAGRGGAVVAGGSLLVGRYLLFGAGEGSVVAIANLPLLLGLWALVRVGRGVGGAPAVLALAASMGLQAAENPYLAPFLPVVALGVAAGRLWRQRRVDAAVGGLLVATAAGAAGVLAVAEMYGRGANPDYPREVAGTLLYLGPLEFTVVDLPWARVAPWEVLWGGPVRWTVDADAGVSAGGGRTLGLTVLALAAVGLRFDGRARPWGLLALAAMVVALGSMVGPVGAPFLYLNSLMAAVARPLTQPVRFLAVVQVAVAVAAGLGLRAAVVRWGPRAAVVAAGAMLLETALLGGGRLRLPVTPLVDAPCLSALADGPVLVWPWDARDGEPSRAQILQLAHQQPAVHPGIASWRPLRASALERVRSMGISERAAGKGRPVERLRLLKTGYVWLVVDEAADPVAAARLAEAFVTPTATCDGYSVYALEPGAVPQR